MATHDVSAPPAASAAPDDRPLKRALWRGWRRRCPACGTGRMFAGYLTVQDLCPACGEELYHQKADDGPAYLTILVVGHVLAPVLHFGYVRFEPAPAVLALVMCGLATALSLYLLPRIKGAFVALQWSHRMNGFGASREPDAALPRSP